MRKLFYLISLILLFDLQSVSAQSCTSQILPRIETGSVTIYTPNGSPLTGYIYMEYCPDAVTALNSFYTIAYPNAQLVSNSTTSYNCHGYAWWVSEGGSPYWIAYTSAFWDDDSYIEVSSPPVGGNCKVSYVSDDHSAITSTDAGKFISKWGEGPLMKHAPGYAPYDASTLKYYVRSCSASPDLQQMTYNNGSVYTVNFVSAGFWYNIYTNIDLILLNSNISWNPSGTVNWYASGTKNVNANLNLSSGQSVTFFMSASNSCGTANRNPSFVAQSAYKILSHTAEGIVKGYFEVEFDNAEYLEILPQTIVIYDQSEVREEMKIDVKEMFKSGQFADKKIRIDVSKLSNGVKIINFLYPKVDGKTSEQILSSTDFEKKSSRIIVSN